MENRVIRDEARKNNVKHWEVAEALGISEATFCRLLRRELPDNQRKKVLEAIRTVSASKKGGD